MAAVGRTPAFAALWLFLLAGFAVLSCFAAAFIAVHRLRAVRPRLE